MAKRRGHETRLASERRAKRLTQADVQLATGIQMSRLSLFENGYAVPTKAQQAALAKLFKVPTSELFGDQAVAS